MGCSSESTANKCVTLLLKISYRPSGLAEMLSNLDMQRLVCLLVCQCFCWLFRAIIAVYIVDSFMCLVFFSLCVLLFVCLCIHAFTYISFNFLYNLFISVLCDTLIIHCHSYLMHFGFPERETIKSILQTLQNCEGYCGLQSRQWL